MTQHEITTSEEWLKARIELMNEEKKFSKARDALVQKRQSLPWKRVEENYPFDTESGRKNLSDLFEGRSQLIVYHFMMGEGWEAGCPSCSLITDSLEGNQNHLSARDVTLKLASNGPLDAILPFKKRMGWTIDWVSAAPGQFNYDFGVSFTKQQLESKTATYNFNDVFTHATEAPGISVFKKIGDEIFHTYSSFGRGLEDFMANYRLLDIVPSGRNESELQFPMQWVKHHDKYEI